MLGFGFGDYVMTCKIILYLLAVYAAAFVASAGNIGSIGGIVDYSSVSGNGKEETMAMEMAILDIYSHLPSNRRLSLHIMDSGNDPFKAASSAKELIKNHNVSAIIGLDRWEEAAFVAELGSIANVPIISLANNVPLSASKQWPFLVNMAHSQHNQMEAVAAIVQSWQWRKVTLIYEDTASIVNDIFPYLIEALSKVNSDIGYYLPLQPLSSPYSNLSENLMDLQRRQNRVFIVHASRNLAINLFMEANRMEMMEKEFVWITTNCVISQVNYLNASTISAMQGVLGVNMMSPSTSQRQYDDFSKRFMTKFRSKYPNETYMEPGTFALTAYDAVYTAVLAIEGRSNPKTLATISNNHDAVNGWKLLERILKTKFKGLSGEVNLKEGTLATSSIFQIVNVIGRSYVELGYWSKGLGFSVKMGKGSTYSASMKILGQVNWPGRPLTVPIGWAVPTSANILRIGVPGSNSFPEYVSIRYKQPGGEPIVEGFSIDVFKATVDNLPYSLVYNFIPYNGTYDSLVQQVYLKAFDAVVGDTTIVANRCEYADFSQPYSDSGLQVLLYTKLKTSAARAWLFKKPFTTWTWVSTAAVNLYSGFVVWFIERKSNRDFNGSWLKQCGTIIWLAFTTLFTAVQGDKLHSNLSRMAAVIWLFVALVITSSYTASLTSLLTIQNLSPRVVDVETLRRTGAKVGCNGNSFVVKYLQDVLNFQPDNIVRLYSEDDYPQALRSGKIAAAFLEVPYIKLFLAKNCKGFMTGETFKVGGFGFVFPKGTPLLSDISKAVLNVSENGKLRDLENAMLSSHKCSESDDDDDDISLGFDSFWGLFAITGGASTIAIMLYLCPATIANWTNFSSKVNSIETEEEHHQQQKQRYEVHNLLNSTLSETQHNPEQDEKFLFVSEMKNQ